MCTGEFGRLHQRLCTAAESLPVDPVNSAWVSPSINDPYRNQLATWLRTDSHWPKRARRTAKMMFHRLKAQGYAN